MAQDITGKKRQVSLDTETTGFDPEAGDRIVEIAAVEMLDGIATKNEFHVHINPCRDVPLAAVQVHGLTTEFLRDKPMFEDIVHDFLDFLGDAEFVAHNAQFDHKFINAELARLGLPPIPNARVIDTLAMARAKFPGQPNSLDALCRRFNISLAGREKHGALIDSRLLAEVYLELNGGRQTSFDLLFGQEEAETAFAPATRAAAVGNGIVIRPTPDEEAAHAAFLAKIKDPIWNSLNA